MWQKFFYHKTRRIPPVKKVLALSILMLLIRAAICLPAYAEGGEDAGRNENLFSFLDQEDWEEGDCPGNLFFATLDFPEAYVLTPVVRSETTDELLIEQIDEFLAMSREEIIKKLGPDYSVEPVGPEGALDGYYYEDLGMAFAFYADSDMPDFIECYPNFRIRGVGIGSLFSEIMEALGNTEIFETWLAHPDDKGFIVYYLLGGATYSFVAFEIDGPVYILRIS